MDLSNLLLPVNIQKITDYYKFHLEIGRGSSGVCFKASSKQQPSKFFCIKKIHKRKNTQSLCKQIPFLDQISHPDIIRLYEIFEDASSFYLVLDLCQGGQLFDYLESKGCLSEKQAKQIFLQIISSIKYCHSMKIAHRDLKPENFLIMEPFEDSPSIPNLKLIDFDLAFKWKNNALKQIFQSEGNRIIGSAYYIAPEIVEGKHDERCDIWSAGVILYMLVSGVPPFDGETTNQILAQIKNRKYTLNIPQFQNVSLLLKDLIKKILQPKQKRLTINEIFNHPWMKINPKNTILPIDFSNLLRFSKFSKLKGIAATYLASRLTSKQTKKLDQVFKEIDQNRDGFLSSSQLKNAFKKTNSSSMKGELENLLNFVQTDKNGMLNYNQFIASTINQKVISSKENLLKVFNMIDKDGNGYVDKDQISNILQKYGVKRNINQERVYSSDVDEIFKSSDKNNDGKIDFEEFVDTICQNLI